MSRENQVPEYEVRSSTPEELESLHKGLQEEFIEYREKHKRYSEHRKQVVAQWDQVSRPALTEVVENSNPSPSEE